MAEEKDIVDVEGVVKLGDVALDVLTEEAYRPYGKMANPLSSF